MRLPNSKSIEGFFKSLYSYSHIGKLIHYLRSRNRPNTVFIWIPKNAGTSLYHALRKYGCIKAKEWCLVKYRFSQTGFVTFGHMDFDQLVQQNYVSNEYKRTAFKFCFCRNPYDRALSFYLYSTKKMQHRPSFLQFWQDIQTNGIDPIGLYNKKVKSICNPQVRWTENIKMDFIGRFEDLPAEINRLMKQLKLPPLKIQHRNKSAKKLNKRILLSWIEELYAEDFKQFNYKLEPD